MQSERVQVDSKFEESFADSRKAKHSIVRACILSFIFIKLGESLACPAKEESSTKQRFHRWELPHYAVL